MFTRSVNSNLGASGFTNYSQLAKSEVHLHAIRQVDVSPKVRILITIIPSLFHLGMLVGMYCGRRVNFAGFFVSLHSELLSLLLDHSKY